MNGKGKGREEKLNLNLRESNRRKRESRGDVNLDFFAKILKYQESNSNSANSKLKFNFEKKINFGLKNNSSKSTKSNTYNKSTNLCSKYFQASQRTLASKYNNSQTEYNSFIIDTLIFNRNCHLVSVFKDYMIFDFVDEFFKREYKYIESKERIPKFANYYKNYLKFFCNPIFREFKINSLIQMHGDNRAELYYKNNYGNKKENPERKIEIEKEDHLKVIFSSTIRLNINNHSLTQSHQTIRQEVLEYEKKNEKLNVKKSKKKRENDNSIDFFFFDESKLFNGTTNNILQTETKEETIINLLQYFTKDNNNNPDNDLESTPRNVTITTRGSSNNNIKSKLSNQAKFSTPTPLSSGNKLHFFNTSNNSNAVTQSKFIKKISHKKENSEKNNINTINDPNTIITTPKPSIVIKEEFKKLRLSKAENFFSNPNPKGGIFKEPISNTNTLNTQNTNNNSNNTPLLSTGNKNDVMKITLSLYLDKNSRNKVDRGASVNNFNIHINNQISINNNGNDRAPGGNTNNNTTRLLENINTHSNIMHRSINDKSKLLSRNKNPSIYATPSNQVKSTSHQEDGDRRLNKVTDMKMFSSYNFNSNNKIKFHKKTGSSVSNNNNLNPLQKKISSELMIKQTLDDYHSYNRKKNGDLQGSNMNKPDLTSRNQGGITKINTNSNNFNVLHTKLQKQIRLPNFQTISTTNFNSNNNTNSLPSTSLKKSTMTKKFTASLKNKVLYK